MKKDRNPKAYDGIPTQEPNPKIGPTHQSLHILVTLWPILAGIIKKRNIHPPRSATVRKDD